MEIFCLYGLFPPPRLLAPHLRIHGSRGYQSLTSTIVVIGYGQDRQSKYAQLPVDVLYVDVSRGSGNRF
jgi:hypothetical protein